MCGRCEVSLPENLVDDRQLGSTTQSRSRFRYLTRALWSESFVQGRLRPQDERSPLCSES
jgi:hypothetical protein